MEKFGRSQPVRRVEDVRFLTGKGRYIADETPEGALSGFVLRSPVAHGRIVALDISAAEEAEGVHLVLTADRLIEAGVRIGMSGALVTNIDGTKGARPERPILARGKVRYVGEAIAFIVADTLAQAKDAAELVEIEIEDEPAHVTVAVGGPQLHADVPGNKAFHYGLGDKEAVEAALASAANVVTVGVPDQRIIVNSMEPRGVTAHTADGRLHVEVNGQGVWGPRDDLAKHFGLDKSEVHVTTPDVGGGFGMKGFTYPELFLVAQSARVLNRPVHWMSERTEAMLSDNGGRDLSTTATIGFDANHRIVAYKLDTIANMGAYNSGFAQNIQTELFSKVMPGTYDIQTAWMECVGVYTNTAPVDAYRGAGRPEAIFVLERTMEFAARKLGIDPWELRRINFIRPDQFPYASVTGMTYDVGDFAKVLARAEAEADKAGFAARRAASQKAGKLRGMGLCYYIESILGDKQETTTVVFADDGMVEIHVGTQSNGQGHETVFTQFLSDHTGIPADRMRFVQGDTDLIAKGGGTGGSRSVTVQNTATLATVETMVEAFSAYLAGKEGVKAEDIAFDDESFRIPGSNLTPTMLEVAEMAREDGRTDLLRHTKTIELSDRSFPNGAHVAEVEIDPETGVTKVVKYTVVDDFGNLINPMLAEGQVHGGVAQGLGQALTERAVFDEDGQLLTATFMDYAMPRADDMPAISFTSEPTPSIYNPMGMKGCGEAGTVGALAAVVNAVQDAVWQFGISELEMPFTPHRVWSMLDDAMRKAS